MKSLFKKGIKRHMKRIISISLCFILLFFLFANVYASADDIVSADDTVMPPEEEAGLSLSSLFMGEPDSEGGDEEDVSTSTTLDGVNESESESIGTVVELSMDASGIEIQATSSDIIDISTGIVEYVDQFDVQQVMSNVMLINGNIPSTLSSGWYALDSTITTNQRVVISGNVNLILESEHLLTANAGIEVSQGSSLTLWAQTAGTTSDTGAIIATGSAQNAGIGGTNGTAGTITINGGRITATGGNNGAGIGGGASGDGGTITINKGVVNAQGGGWGAAGIGGGSANPGGVAGGGRSGTGGIITITGGTVTATGNSSTYSGLYNWNIGGGAGIGGAGANNSNITGTGANTTNGMPSGAGGTITITGGSVTATGGNGYAYWGCGGAGIGSGGAGGEVIVGDDGTIMINGGSVTAKGGAGSTTPLLDGANIGFGGGYDPPNSSPGVNLPTASNVKVSSETPMVGTTLTATYTYVAGTNTSGTADTQNPSATTYQWYRSATGTTGSSITPISGATSSTYTPTGADIGMYLRFMVTTVNTDGVIGVSVVSGAVGQVGLEIGLIVISGDNNDFATIQDTNAASNPDNSVLTATNTNPQSIILYSVNVTPPTLTAQPDSSTPKNIQWAISPVNGGTFGDGSISMSTSLQVASQNPGYTLPVDSITKLQSFANLTQSIEITVTFTTLEILDAPTEASFDTTGKISFTSSADNVNANATYTYSLYQNGNQIITNPIDIINTDNPASNPNMDGSVTYNYTMDATDLVSQMLSAAGSYFAVITATTTAEGYLDKPVSSAPNIPSVEVFEVRVTTKGITDGDEVTVILYVGGNGTQGAPITTNTTTSIYQFRVGTSNQVWLTANPGMGRVAEWSPGSGSQVGPNTHSMNNTVNTTITFRALYTTKSITSFTLAGVTGVIDEISEAISVTLPFGTAISSLTPTLTQTGVNIDPKGVQDFTSPVTYTVAAEDGSTQSYTVTVTIEEEKIDASISSNNAIFDQNLASIDLHNDIAIILAPGSYNLVSISLNDTILTSSQDYIISENTITLLATYLCTVEIGQNVYILNMDGGISPTMTVNIVNTEAALDIIGSAYAIFTGTEKVSWKIDVPLQSFFRMIQVDGITISTMIVDQSNFTLIEGSTTITMSMLQSYIEALPDGEYHFRAEFANGHADLYLTVSTESQQGGGTGDPGTNPGGGSSSGGGSGSGGGSNTGSGTNAGGGSGSGGGSNTGSGTNPGGGSSSRSGGNSSGNDQINNNENENNQQNTGNNLNNNQQSTSNNMTSNPQSSGANQQSNLSNAQDGNMLGGNMLDMAQKPCAGSNLHLWLILLAVSLLGTTCTMLIMKRIKKDSTK